MSDDSQFEWEWPADEIRWRATARIPSDGDDYVKVGSSITHGMVLLGCGQDEWEMHGGVRLTPERARDVASMLLAAAARAGHRDTPQSNGT